MGKKNIIVTLVLLVLLISPIDILPGNFLDDIGYIIGLVSQGKALLNGGQ